MPECQKFAGTETNRRSGKTLALKMYLEHIFQHKLLLLHTFIPCKNCVAFIHSLQKFLEKIAAAYIHSLLLQQ